MPDSNPTSTVAAPLGAAAPISVLLVDESASSRRLLRGGLQATDEFVVVGESRTCRDAALMVERMQPAIVLMHLSAPVATGLAAIEKIMATRPTPIVVYSGELGADGTGCALDALSAGAIEVVATPDWDNAAGVERSVGELRKLLRAASRIKVITHPRGKLRPAAPPPDNPGAAVPSERAISLVVIGASTGGPQALAEVLGGLPADFAPAVLVVQHMADGFIPGLVTWLDTVTPLRVGVAEAGRILRPGTVSIAPSGHNVKVASNLRVALTEPSERQFHVPGIDPAFCSVAESVGPHAIGILLTGMGRDGATGLKSLRDAGAVTIGQDEASCAVYGMPGVAMTLGGVEHQLPLVEIAPAVVRLVRSAS
ncbi:MAG: two-component system, chemotaxis family, protein-glutamate methylesterase/glutaminase [Frankiaceae bacterium]|nr:two-component system, chemotaxis family, protein-glutamate methylesterase/glutaminase [Frankiaceae bacterium]